MADSGKYEAAVAALKAGRPPLSADAADLLATCLYLEGKRFEALSVWNRNGKPRLDGVAFFSPERSDRAFLQSLLGAHVGAMLAPRRLLAGERVLRDAGVACTTTPVVEPGGSCRLEITVNDRKGPFSDLFHFAIWGGGSAAASDAQFALRDFNGRATSIAIHGRWAERRDMVEARLSFITLAPVLVRHTGRARVEERSFESGGGGLIQKVNRSVISWEAAVPLSTRVDAVVGIGRLERWAPQLSPSIFAQVTTGARYTRPSRLGRRANVEASITFSPNVDRSAASFTKGSLRGELDLPVSSTMKLSLAGYFQAVSRSAPFEELVMAGVGRGSDQSLPLRGHGLFRDGALGHAPTGLRGILIQSTLSHKVMVRGPLEIWTEIFADEARLWERVDPGTNLGWIFDAGVGMRITVPGGITAGLRKGYSFTDHSGVWMAYVGERM